MPTINYNLRQTTKTVDRVELVLEEDTVPPGNRQRSSQLNLVYVQQDSDFAAANAVALGAVFTLTF